MVQMNQTTSIVSLCCFAARPWLGQPEPVTFTGDPDRQVSVEDGDNPSAHRARDRRYRRFAGASALAFEAKAFLTADVNFTQVHDSEPSIMQGLIDGFAAGPLNLTGVSTRGCSAAKWSTSAKAACRRCNSRERIYSE